MKTTIAHSRSIEIELNRLQRNQPWTEKKAINKKRSTRSHAHTHSQRWDKSNRKESMALSTTRELVQERQQSEKENHNHHDRTAITSINCTKKLSILWLKNGSD